MKIGQTNINDQIIVTTQKVLVENHIDKEEPKSNGNNFNSIKYWEERYFNGGNSGNGSYGFLAEYKKDFINQFIVENNIKSLLEYGCGDCNQLSMIDCEKIIGVDVSKHYLLYNGTRWYDMGTFPIDYYLEFDSWHCNEQMAFI
jgi:hypothetical protein